MTAPIQRLKRTTVRLEDYTLPDSTPAQEQLMRNDFTVAQRLNDFADVLNAQSESLESAHGKLDYTNGKVGEALRRVGAVEQEIKQIQKGSIDWGSVIRKAALGGIIGGITVIVTALIASIGFLFLKHAAGIIDLGRSIQP